MARRLFGAGVVAAWAALLFAAGSASATTTTLFNQNTSDWGNNIISTTNTGRVSADDFVVPAGKTWTLSEVDATGMSGCTAGDTVDVVIYNDASGLPGSQQYSATVTPADGVVQTGCNFAIPISVTLAEGHYWLSVQPHDYWWHETTEGNGTTVSGYGAAFYDALGECGAVGWKSAYACLNSWGSWYQDYDLMFALQGTEASTDTTGPEIAITAPADGASYLLGQSVTADYTCTDSDSGVASCTGPVDDGAAIDTSTVGSHTFTVNAEDNAGNPSTESVTYTVAYDWSGFFQPVRDGAVTAKAGSSIPMKFGLNGDQGSSIFAAGSPTSIAVDCKTGSPLAGAVDVATAGVLSYNALTGQYAYVWKTSKDSAGQCRRFDMTLADGTTHHVFVTFSK